MPEMKDVAPCGIYCAGCVVYKASNNPELAEAIAGNLGINEEEARCEGCRAQSGNISVLPTEEKCPTYTCVTEKGLDFCFECEDYPCSRLYTCKNSPLPHNSKINNLTLIDKKGLDWFLERAEKLTKLYYKGIKEHGGSKLETPEKKKNK